MLLLKKGVSRLIPLVKTTIFDATCYHEISLHVMFYSGHIPALGSSVVYLFKSPNHKAKNVVIYINLTAEGTLQLVCGHLYVAWCMMHYPHAVQIK